jgi:hypothetical protein
MNRETAQRAYQRVREWEQRQTQRLREAILIPFFGGCGCRMHNCRVNYESNGFRESPITIDGRTYSHGELAALSKRFDYEQRKLWDTAKRLQTAFARHF